MNRLPEPFGDDVVLRSIDWLEDLPWRQENGLPNKHKYVVNINVKGFAPDEIKLKVVDGFVVMEAAHDERKDEYGYISRRIVRKFPLPDYCLEERVESSLSANGILTVIAPRKPILKENTAIPVTVESSVKSKL